MLVAGELVALSGLAVTLVLGAEASAGLVWSALVLAAVGELTVAMTFAGTATVWLMTGVNGDLTFGAIGVGLGANGTGCEVVLG